MQLAYLFGADAAPVTCLGRPDTQICPRNQATTYREPLRQMTEETLNGEAIDRLFALIEERRTADPDESYTAKLFSRGRSKILQKTGEEAVETIIAAMADDPAEVAKESADLIYHLLVLWSETGVRPHDVYAELARREGTSGLEEKKGRNGNAD